MAKYGAKRPLFAPIVSEPDDDFPTYGPSIVIGRLIKVDVTPSFASGKLYGDDELVENVDEFVSASAAMETDDLLDAVATGIYGAKTVNGEVHYKAGDTAPRGGISFYTTLMRKGVKSYKGYYYPAAQATLGADNAQTKGDNITFGTSTTNFTIYACNTGKWRITKEFPTEAAAKAWCEDKLGGAPGPTPEPDEGDGQG